MADAEDVPSSIAEAGGPLFAVDTGQRLTLDECLNLLMCGNSICLAPIAPTAHCSPHPSLIMTPLLDGIALPKACGSLPRYSRQGWVSGRALADIGAQAGCLYFKNSRPTKRQFSALLCNFGFRGRSSRLPLSAIGNLLIHPFHRTEGIFLFQPYRVKTLR